MMHFDIDRLPAGKVPICRGAVLDGPSSAISGADLPSALQKALPDIDGASTTNRPLLRRPVRRQAAPATRPAGAKVSAGRPIVMPKSQAKRESQRRINWLSALNVQPNSDLSIEQHHRRRRLAVERPPTGVTELRPSAARVAIPSLGKGSQRHAASQYYRSARRQGRCHLTGRKQCPVYRYPLALNVINRPIVHFICSLLGHQPPIRLNGYAEWWMNTDLKPDCMKRCRVGDLLRSRDSKNETSLQYRNSQPRGICRTAPYSSPQRG